MNNSFSGKIPEFNQLTALKSIYLSNNRFSGDIPPDYFARMLSLKKLWLSNNEFSGHIPLSLATTLPKLMELHLENNQFTGIIPNFTQPGLADVNLSNNRLTGEIPPGLSRFKASSFAGNSDLCGAELGTTCTQPGISTASISVDGDKKAEYKSKYYIAFGTLGFLFILIIFFLLILKKRRTSMLRTSEQDNTEDQQIQVSRNARSAFI